jgi:hypothetical protein
MAEIPEPVFVGIPVRLGRKIGSSLFESLSKYEQAGINEAAKAIYETYLVASEGL